MGGSRELVRLKRGFKHLVFVKRQAWPFFYNSSLNNVNKLTKLPISTNSMTQEGEKVCCFSFYSINQSAWTLDLIGPANTGVSARMTLQIAGGFGAQNTGYRLSWYYS